MPSKELKNYLNSIKDYKWLNYKSLRQEKNVDQGIDLRYDHQGIFKTADGLEYHNLQIQTNKQSKSVNVKGLSRKNGTSGCAACVLVAFAWNGPEGVLRAAMEESSDLGSGDGKYCRNIWLHEDGTTEPAGDNAPKSVKAAEERKAAKAAKEAGDAKRRANRN